MSYTSALYVLTGSAGIGVAFASLFFGPLSDKLGRKFCLLLCMYVGAVLTVVKYLCRHDFWLFNIANFLNGLFGASTVVATSYIADIYSDDKDKLNEAMGGVMGLAMLGGNAGNILAIAMENAGLFIPLLPGAALAVLNTSLILRPCSSATICMRSSTWIAFVCEGGWVLLTTPTAGTHPPSYMRPRATQGAPTHPRGPQKAWSRSPGPEPEPSFAGSDP